MAFNFSPDSNSSMDIALPGDPDHQLWRANQPIRFHRLMGNKSKCGGGNHHRHGQSCLVSGPNQYSHGWLVLFQRSAVEELSEPVLSGPFPVKTWRPSSA